MFKHYEPPRVWGGPVQFFNWMVSFRNPYDIWQENYTVLYTELFSFVLAAILVYLGFKKDRTSLFQAIAADIAFCSAEVITGLSPDSRSWWFEHPTINMFGCTIPLLVVASYFCIQYISISAAKALVLPKILEMCLATLVHFFVMGQAELLAGQHLMWQWHEHDPMYHDRVFGVPLTKVIGIPLISFNAILVWDLIPKNLEDTLNSKIRFPLFRIMTTAVLCEVLMMAEYGTIFYLVRLHLKGHTASCGLMILLIFGLLAITATGHLKKSTQKSGISPTKDYVFYLCMLSFTASVLAGIIVKPENLRSIGPHQPLGPCEIKEKVINQMAVPVERTKYICPSRKSGVGKWDFHCLSSEELLHLPNAKGWYPICGKPLLYKTDLVIALTTNAIISMLCLYAIFYKIDTNKVLINGHYPTKKQI